MNTHERLCNVCGVRKAAPKRFKCNSCKNVHLKDIQRPCNQCHNAFAAPGRLICWNCKLRRNHEKHPENRQRRLARKRLALKKQLNDTTFRARYLQAARAYREEHREKARETSRLWREKYPERHRGGNARWRAAYPERVRSNSLRQKTLYPERIRLANKLRKARMRKAKLGHFPHGAWSEMVTYFGYCCAYCLQALEVVTMDHMIPVTRGGVHDITNVVPCCSSCNTKKGNKNLLEWLLYGNTKKFVGIGMPSPTGRLGRFKQHRATAGMLERLAAALRS